MEWLERFDANVGTVRKWYDEAFVRAWRLYLGGLLGGLSVEQHSALPGRVHPPLPQPPSPTPGSTSTGRAANGADWSFN